MIETSRRALLTGLISLVAAPAIVRAGSLMPVKQMVPSYWPAPMLEGWTPIATLRFVLWKPDEQRWDERWALVEDDHGTLVIRDLPSSPGS